MKIFKNLKLNWFKSKKKLPKLLNFIAKGRATGEGGGASFDRYTGVGLVNIIAVNPDKEELSKIQDREVTEEPIYVYPQKTADDKNMVRISFIAKTTDHEENNGVDITSNLNFYLRDQYLFSNKSAVQKVKVIDNYGQTSWVTEDELKEQKRPIQKNGKDARILPPYRPMYLGEEELIEFLKKFLNVPAATIYNRDSGEWLPSPDIDDAQISLGDMTKYFSGDLSDLKKAISALKDNYIKVLFYVRTTEDNKVYQSILSDLVLSPNSRATHLFEEKVIERKEFNAYQDAYFTYDGLEVYSLSPSTFKEEPKAAPDSKFQWGK